MMSGRPAPILSTPIPWARSRCWCLMTTPVFTTLGSSWNFWILGRRFSGSSQRVGVSASRSKSGRPWLMAYKMRQLPCCWKAAGPRVRNHPAGLIARPARWMLRWPRCRAALEKMPGAMAGIFRWPMSPRAQPLGIWRFDSLKIIGKRLTPICEAFTKNSCSGTLLSRLCRNIPAAQANRSVINHSGLAWGYRPLR